MGLRARVTGLVRGGYRRCHLPVATPIRFGHQRSGVDKSVAEALLTVLDITPDESTTGSSDSEHNGELPEVSLSDGKVDEVLQTLKEVNTVAFNALMALLQGGVGP